ncbi:MAG TPA: hypothetical protein VM925_07200 [Labilithrix sp.]|nr:hypothetical protein [Labilithrix sp.]
MLASYDVPSECPDASAFEAKVETYGSEVTSAAVAVSRTAPGYHGRVVIGSAPAREVDAATCEEVADALALITALLLREAPPPRETTPAAPTPVTEPVERRAPVAPSVGVEPRSITIAAGATGATGVGPDVAAGATLGVAFEPRWRGLDSVRLMVDRTLESNASSASGRAAFALTAARIEVCVLRFGRDAASLSLCAGALAGALAARGERIDPPRSDTRAYEAATLTAHAELFVYRAFHVAADVSLRAPLHRDRFYFQPGERLYETPAVALAGGLLVGARFR